MTRCLPALALLLLAGCVDVDPYTREGVWRPTGVNDANLAAMLADPRDRLRGVGTTTSLGETSTAAVERLFGDKPRPLPVTTSQTTEGMANTAGGGAAQ